MWYRVGVVCGLLLALLVGSPHADVQCDGTDDFISFSGTTMGTFLLNNTFTLMAYVKSTGSAFGDANCWTEGAMLIDGLQNLSMGRSNTPGGACVQVFGGSGLLRVGTMGAGWHHLAATLSGGTLTLYVDGVSVQSGGVSVIADMAPGLFLCGLNVANQATSPDTLTEVKVYNVLVPAAEIERIAKSKLRRYERTTPTGYWPLQDCTAGTPGNGVSFNDRSGNNRNGTGDDGANNSGLTCRGSEWVSRPQGVN